MRKVPWDHFVPRTYLRGFTCKNPAGDNTGLIVVYPAGFGVSKTLGINAAVACEPEFYDKHPLDKKWSETIERTWPAVRTRLENREVTPDLLDELFQFASAQWIRTPRYMNEVARLLALQKATISPIEFQGHKGNGMFLDMTSTNEVMAILPVLWADERAALEEDYAWQVFHGLPRHAFLTSDNPAQCDPSRRVTMPLSLDMALVGTLLGDDSKGTFNHVDATPDVINEINRTTVAGCDSFVYAHEATEELRRFVEKNYVSRDLLLRGRSFTKNP
jgi:hypothetical protein